MNCTIERVDTYVLHVPLRREIADALYVRRYWRIPVVEIRTSDGVVGTGYSGVWEGHDLIIDTIDRYLAPMIVGADASCIGDLWSEMYWSPLHWVGRAGVTHMGLGMVDVALWDIASRRAGLPLWKMLGGQSGDVDTYNTDGGWLNFSLNELIDDTLEMVDQGWTAVKMKIGGPNPREDVERVAHLRSKLPDHVQLMVDVNQRWDLFTARRYVGALNDLGVAWLEEPLHPDDVLGHSALARMSEVPIALGENVYSAESFASFLRADAVDVVQVDATRVAGITEWLRVAQAAVSASRRVIPHAGDMMQVHQHLISGVLQPSPMIEYLPWALDVFEEPVQLIGSRIRLPRTPGASTAVASDSRRRYGKVE